MRVDISNNGSGGICWHVQVDDVCGEEQINKDLIENIISLMLAAEKQYLEK